MPLCGGGRVHGPACAAGLECLLRLQELAGQRGEGVPAIPRLTFTVTLVISITVTIPIKDTTSA